MVAAAERRPTDEQLGELTGTGDVEAFATLCNRHFQGLYDLARRIVGDDETAAEVLYGSLTTVWATLRWRRVEDLRSCLYAAAYQAAVESASGRKDPLRSPGRNGSDSNFTALQTRRLADPTAALGDPELIRLVWETAAALPARDYGLLDLQLRKGIGPAQLARELGLKRKTIDARLARLKEQLVRSVFAGRTNGEAPRVSPLAVFAALAPLAVPEGLRESVECGVLEYTRAPSRRRRRPRRSAIVIASAVLLTAAAGAVVALRIPGGPDDPTGFHSATHQAGAQTSDGTIAVQWTPQPEATGYSILWSHERALPDETVDLAATAAETERAVTPGEWWFNLRTRGGSGAWTNTVHVGPFLIVPVPDTKIVSRPEARSNDRRPSFRLESTGEGTFECSLDGATFERCGSRPDIGRVRSGRHRLEARVRDRYGNADATPAVWVWRLDTNAPRTRIVSAALDDRDAMFRFASSERKSTFQCRMDAGDFTRCRSPLSVRDLRQGDHVFVVRAVDAAGNRDRSPAFQRWEVDTQAPRTRIVSGPSGVVHRARATFVLDSNEDQVSFECSLDGGAFAPCPTTASFAGLRPGGHTFFARAEDEAGNVDATPARRRWTVVGTSRPNTTITDHPRVSSNDRSPTFRFRSSEKGSTFECRLDSGSWQACSSPRTYNGLASGQHVFRVRARDAAGNVDRTPATWTWTIH